MSVAHASACSLRNTRAVLCYSAPAPTGRSTEEYHIPMRVFGHRGGAGYRPGNTLALARCRTAGLDGVFCDYPDRALAARHRD